MNKREKEIAKENPTYGVEKRTRRDWGNINPITKVIPNKKKNQKEKHRDRRYDE